MHLEKKTAEFYKLSEKLDGSHEQAAPGRI